jgi:hypothetical protein
LKKKIEVSFFLFFNTNYALKKTKAHAKKIKKQ